MKKRGMLAALLAAGFISASALGSSTPLQQLLDSRPGVRAFNWEGKLSRLYGAPMSTGSDPEDSAWNLLEQHAAAFGADLADLQQLATADGLAYQPVMYNRGTGDYKFFAIYFAQVRGGVSVFDSNLTLVVRNDRAAGYPVVLAVNNLKDLSTYVQPQGQMNESQVKSLRNGYPVTEALDRVIYVDEKAGEQPVARLAFTYISETGSPEDGIAIGINGEHRHGTYDKRRLIVDAVTGQTLHEETLVHSVDVVGNVKGKATPGLLPDKTNNVPMTVDLPNVTVQVVGGNSANTDAAGDYVISHSGNTQVTVRSRMVGPSLLQGVFPTGGTAIQIDLNVLPPGPADFIHNDVPTELVTSQVNAMLQTSMIHSRVIEINPSYPNINRTFRANVNLTDTCNAFYNGSSINFYRRGGGCWNTAYSTVVHHEYGHKLVGDAGTNQGAYGEGMGDVMAIVMTESPITGEDFFESGQDIRDARAGRQYPCSGEIHFCGQILSGCAYFTQEALRVTEPSEYRNILADLAINSMLFRPSGITPGVTIDWLTLDDDDNNLGNGTPHYAEIDDGFSRHNMDPPPLELLDFSYPNGQPARIDPAGGTTFRVSVSGLNSQPQSGTGTLHYNDGTSGWLDVAMNEVQPNIYDATFPAIECGRTVRYYVSAETTDNELVTDPDNAPVGSFSTISANGIITYFADNFETDMGWTVQNQSLTDGAWERGVPAGDGSRQDPANDYDGSGRCFLTGNRSGNSDVDGGPTQLTSPTFDMSAGDGTLRYARWFVSVNGVTDRFTVEISNNNGANWTTIENITSQGEQWVLREVQVGNYVAPTATMKLRFTATDNPNDSVTEAGIDAVEIFKIDCGGGYTLNVTGSCPGSVNVAWSGAQPSVQQGIVFGNNLGTTIIPTGPCQGTSLGISGSVQLIQTISTGNGGGSINGNANQGACGHYLQLVQAGSCQTSNPDQIP